MLEHLFGSRTRVKLLTLFLHHPEEKFYVRELTRRVQTQINAVRREIQNLVRIGFLREGGEADAPGDVKRPGIKRKYYAINTQFPLFHEIQSLITKAHVFLERKLDSHIERLGEVEYLAFLGAFLGHAHAPVDVFLVGTVNERELKKLLQELERELGFEINYTCMTPQEFIYRKDIADRFLHSILQAPKNVIIDRLDQVRPSRA